MGMPSFWLIFFAVLSAALVDQAFIQHQVLYLQRDLKIDKLLVAEAVSLMGVIGIFARPAVGAFFDRLSNRGISLSYLTLAIAAGLALAALNPAMLMLFVVFRAVGHAAVLLDTTVLAKHTFGMQNLGALLGIFTAAVNLGFMIGPWMVARMYDSTGSYTLPFIVCIGIAIFAAAILLPLRPQYWVQMRERAKARAAANNAAA